MKVKSNILNFIVLSFILCGCSMTIKNDKGDKCSLVGFGHGKAELPSGCKIEKGLVDFPDIDLNN